MIKFRGVVLLIFIACVLSFCFNELAVRIVECVFNDCGYYLWTQFFIMGFFFVLTFYIFFDIYYISVLKDFFNRMHKHKQKQIGDSPTISVVIPAFNEEKYIGETINSVLQSDYPKDKLEVIVVDDGSTDDTYKEAAKYGVQIIRHAKNLGRGKALETGVKYASGEIVVFLDADTKLKKSALKRLISAFDDPKVGGACGRLLVSSTRSNILTTGQKVEYALGFAYTKILRSAMGWLLIPSGAFSAHRRKLLLDLNLSDTIAEDFDLGLYIIEKGYRLVYINDAVAITEIPSTPKSYLKQRNRWTIGGLQVMGKHKSIFLNTEYGIVGVFGLPLHFVVGFAATLMELFGYVFLDALAVLSPLISYFSPDKIIALFFWLILLKILSVILILPGYHFSKAVNKENIPLYEVFVYWFVYYYLMLYATARGIINYISGKNIEW